MSLESQLSLAQNGGVYYEGTRVTPTEDAVLFVGLGGTGADALLRVKNEIQTRMPLPKGDNGQILRSAPNNIAFLAVDTDKEILKKSYGVAGFDPSGEEFVNITVDGLPQVYAEVVEKHRNEPQWNWLDPELNPNGGLNGANGIRQMGRFMLIHNIALVQKNFTKAIEDVLRGAKSTNLLIFILGGIGGGTGSGTFLDVAYILRSIALTKTPNVQLHGYVFTPDLNKGNGGDVKSLYRNGFAALKELDYWMSAGEHLQHFVQRYSDDFIVNSAENATEIPVDFCHIITEYDANHKQITYNEAMDTVAENLFAYIVSEQVVDGTGNIALKQTYDNIAGYMLTMSKAYPANFGYLSVGSDKLEIPYTEITTLVAARVFQKLAPTFEREPDLNTFNNDMKIMRLTKDQLWGYIHKEVTANPLQGKDYHYDDIWPNNGVYHRAEQWLIDAQVIMRKNRSNLCSVHEKFFRDYCEKLMKDAQYGPCYAARMISSTTSFCLIKTLEGFRDDCRERMSTASSRAPGLKSELEQIFAGGRTANILAKGRVTREYLEAAAKWLNNESAYWAYYELADGVDDLIERLKLYYSRIFKPLQDTLCALPGIFNGNLDKIAVDQQEAQKHPEDHKKYLIRPLDFEKMYSKDLSKKVSEASVSFLTELCDNLKRWVGIEMDDIDSTILESTDIGGAIARFINDNFNTTLTMNMEQLLSREIPAGVNAGDFYSAKIRDLRDGAVPMFHMGVVHANLPNHAFSLISVPNDCPQLLAAANAVAESGVDTPKISAERSKLQWVKIMAGMPLFAFSEVGKMEKEYEKAMQAGGTIRQGVHLRWEWREQMPSPLPEATWPDAVKGEPEKEFSKTYNARIRKAFDRCLEAGIIRPDSANENELLYLADEAQFQNLELQGTVQQKKEMLEAIRKGLWSDPATAIKMAPRGGSTDDPLAQRVRENVLRFYNISEKILRQTELLDQLEQMASGFSGVEYYIDAYFCGLIYDQGFDRKFRRSELDYSPVKLLNLMTPSAYPDYDTYRTFQELLTKDVKDNIDSQMERAKTGLLAADGGFNKEAVAEKVASLKSLMERIAQDGSRLRDQISRTPIEQRQSLAAAGEFYEVAVEVLNNYITMFDRQM